jgi:hypothetical protein
MTRSKSCVLCGVAFLLLQASQAHAYIDPASGSMMLQLVLGGLAGLAVAVRLMWKRIRALFHRGQAEPMEDAEHGGPEAPHGL